MPFLVGALGAFVVCTFARAVGFARDRVFYPVMLVVIASYYLLFAVMGGSMEALAQDGVAAAVFIAVAVLGFRVNRWLVVFGLAAHGVLDLVHGHLIANPGAPAWWPAFCLAFDVGAALHLAIALLSERNRPGAPDSPARGTLLSSSTFSA